MANAFVYGTLMAPEVLNLLIKRVPPMKPAYIKGYKRYRVKGQVFPAILRDMPESHVEGQVLLGLNEKEVHILDVYESEEYYKENVKPVLDDGTEVEAMVYIWHDKFRACLEPTAWDYSEWRGHNLHHWTARSELSPSPYSARAPLPNASCPPGLHACPNCTTCRDDIDPQPWDWVEFQQQHQQQYLQDTADFVQSDLAPLVADL